MIRIELKSLDRDESVRFVTTLPGAADVPGLDELAIARCGGNPLFTEEFVRFVVDRRSGGNGFRDAGPSDTMSDAPDSLLALISARLDALPPELKSLLADAAVVGQDFWPGVLAAIGDRDAPKAEELLGQLVRREFVLRRGESTLESEAEYSFWHALIRDVAYEQLPRAARAAKHAATGRWIESVAHERPVDLAEILAHHYSTALELARSTGQDQLAGELLDPAARSLGLAGDRALPLDSAAADRHFAAALSLLPPGSRQRPGLLASWGHALTNRGRFREAADAFYEAKTTFASSGERHKALVAAAYHAYAQSLICDGLVDFVQTAEALLDEDEASMELLGAFSVLLTLANHASMHDLELALMERSLALHARLGVPESVSDIVDRGYVRCARGDPAGLADLERALEIAEDRVAGHELCALYCNVGEALSPFKGPCAALALHRRALALAQQCDDPLATCFSRTLMCFDLASAGEWESVIADAEALEGALEGLDDIYDLQPVRAKHAVVRALRGDAAAAEGGAAWAEKSSRSLAQASVRAQCLIALAIVRANLGQGEEAVRLLEDCAAMPPSAHLDCEQQQVPEALRTAFALARSDLATRLAEGLPASRPYDSGTLMVLAALLDEQRGGFRPAASRFADAAAIWAELGIRYELGQARLGQGRCLLALGAAPEAVVAPLAEAREIFARLGARPAQAKTDSVLEQLNAETGQGAGGTTTRSPAEVPD